HRGLPTSGGGEPPERRRPADADERVDAGPRHPRPLSGGERFDGIASTTECRHGAASRRERASAGAAWDSCPSVFFLGCGDSTGGKDDRHALAPRRERGHRDGGRVRALGAGPITPRSVTARVGGGTPDGSSRTPAPPTRPARS